ncbi:MAG: chemotaxis protein CheW [Desulfuromonadaceae bacterium]|nr:chemotaxis protein CheW [Desulfuromonadaceae bacterium]
MDLAKIRKKSLLALKEFGDERFTAQMPSSGLVQDTSEPVAVALNLTETGTSLPESFAAPETVAPVAPVSVATVWQPEPALASCTPLESILAARTAAGCDIDSMCSDVNVEEAIAESALEFLCFRVSDEIYGIDIMDIKEIIKPREVTEVPRTPAFVLGVLSLRGTIIPVIDMRFRLGLAPTVSSGKERIVVIKYDASYSGLLVDEVIQVVKVPQNTVEAAPPVLEGIDRDFVSGIGRSDGRLIIILNLKNITDINLY